MYTPLISAVISMQFRRLEICAGVKIGSLDAQVLLLRLRFAGASVTIVAFIKSFQCYPRVLRLRVSLTPYSVIDGFGVVLLGKFE